MELKSFHFMMMTEDGHKIYNNNFIYEEDLENAIKTVYKLALGYLDDTKVTLKKWDALTDIYEDFNFNSLEDLIKIYTDEEKLNRAYFTVWKNEKPIIEFSVR